MATPEGKVKAWVKAALDRLGVYRFMPVQNGMGSPSLDFLCCLRGYYIAIETKVPGKHLTERQQATTKAILDAGGMVFVVRTKEDVEHMEAMLALTGQGRIVPGSLHGAL